MGTQAIRGRELMTTFVRRFSRVLPLVVFLGVSAVADSPPAARILYVGSIARCSPSVSVVYRVENFEGSLLSLKGKGISPDSTEKDSTGQFAHFHDPDGNEVSIWA